MGLRFFVFSQRIVSKLGDVGSFGEDPRRIKYAGDTEGIRVAYQEKYAEAQQVIRDRYENLEVPYYGADNNNFRGGESFCCGNKASTAKTLNNTNTPGITANDDPELYQYYYHADHLGSASYLTNLDGEIAQHIEYVPFGEVFLEERNNKWNSPYLFNGKELDEETGLSYYGARYYNPRVSQWLSVDPKWDHPKQISMSPYAYTANNPVRYIDPTGMIWEDPKQAERLNKSINKRIASIEKSSAKAQAKIDEGKLSNKRVANKKEIISENAKKKEMLRQSLKDIEAIGKAKETFRLSSPSQDNGEHGVVKGDGGVIKIEGSNTGLHIHEIRHVGQSLEAGGVKFNAKGQLKNPAKTYAGARNNEVNAYQTQYSFDGSFPAGASSLKDINSRTLMDIKNDSGKVIYKALQGPKSKKK